MTVCELIAALARMPPDAPVEVYEGDAIVNVVVLDGERVLLMERPFDVGDPATLWREFFEAGRAKESP